MANTAFEHSPTITVPGSGNSTDNAVVLWNGTTGNNFSNSTIIVGATTMGLAADTNLLTFGDTTLAIAGAVTGVTSLVVDDITINGTSITTIASDNNINITPNGTGSVVISKVDINSGDITGVTISGGLTWSAAQTFGAVTATQVDITAQGDLRLQDNTGGQYIAFDSPATVSTSYTVTMPAGLPIADKVLKVTSISSNIATMEWGEAGAALTPWTSNIDTDGYDLITDDGNKDINIIPHGTGKVGIGTTAPTENLSVIGAGGTITGTTLSTFSAQQDYNPRRGVMLGYDSSGQIGIISATTHSAAADLAFWSYPGAGQGGWTEKMRLKANGEFTVKENTTMASVTKGIAKAWCKFDGTASGPITPTVAYNVTDVTDNGTGLYTVNFNPDFNTAHFVVVAGGNALHHVEHNAAAAGTYSVKGLNSGHSNEDAARMYLIAFGELE